MSRHSLPRNTRPHGTIRFRLAVSTLLATVVAGSGFTTTAAAAAPGHHPVQVIKNVILRDAGQPGAAPTTEAQLRRERRFREQYGFQSDLAYINSIHVRPDAVVFESVTLLPAEVSELQLRARIEEYLSRRTSGAMGSSDFRNYLDNHPDEFAGFYFDQAGGGVVHALFTAHVAEHQSALAQLFPFASRLAVSQAPRSWQELTASQGRVNSLMEQLANAGVRLDFVGIAPAKNIVEVGIAPFDPASKARASLILHGLPVKIEPGIPTTATGEHEVDAPPYRGGQYITHDLGTGYESTCTSAFVVQSGSTYYVASAGHCGSVGEYWNQGDSCTFCLTSYGVGFVRDQAYGQGNDDALVIEANNQSASSHQIFITRRSCGFFCTENDYRNVGSVEYAPYVGESACLAGSTSGGEQCTTITIANTCLDEKDDNGNLHHLCNQDMPGYRSIPGDSGGSWYSPGTSGTSKALGINSGGGPGGGGQSNYTEITPALNYFAIGLQVVTGS